MSHEEFDPEDIPYFFDNWCTLPWSGWVPFNADKPTYHTLPKEPGVYRIRPAGKDFLMYIGSSGQPLHTRLSGLRQALRRADLMPWSDPHPEAPALWCWWKEWIAAADEGEEVMLECSAAPLDASAAGRKSMEAFLLYRYRQEYGESTLCNFGRFHPRYRKSTNRSEGKRGGKLEDGQQDNPAGFPSFGPLEATGKPGDPDWMGLEWPAFAPLDPETARGIGPGAGLYLLADAETQEIVYIGQSADVAGRLGDHSRKTREGRAITFSCQIIGQSVLPHNLRELENDLTGNFFEQYRKAPELQFRGPGH
jgi:hypothetical protein